MLVLTFTNHLMPGSIRTFLRDIAFLGTRSLVKYFRSFGSSGYQQQLGSEALATGMPGSANHVVRTDTFHLSSAPRSTPVADQTSGSSRNRGGVEPKLSLELRRGFLG